MPDSHKSNFDIPSDMHAAAARARDVGKLAMSFAEKNIASSFEFAEKLARARNAEEVMRLQSDYVTSQMAALSDQARDLGEEAVRMAKKTGKPD